jgi:hypothetical protein
MNASVFRTWLGLIGLLLLLGLAGCNFPGSATSTVPAAQYTDTAEAVAAEITAILKTGTPPGPGSVKPTLQTPGTPSTSATQPPVPTATFTSQATPTESLTLLFKEDFSSETGWYTDENEDFAIAFAEGGYKFSVFIPYANIWSIRDINLTDVVLEVEAGRLAGPEDGFYGLVCRQVDADNYYALVIGSTGFYGIGKMLDGEFEFIQEGQDTTNILTGTRIFNYLRADCIGDRLRLYANGQKLLEVQDADFSEGVTGLVAGTQKQTGLEVLFDNFASYEP